ncbi:integrase [Paraburkholderia youngii]
MDTTSLWITAPSDAYRLWQEAEAVGADRKPFSARSRVQHAAMFARFHRHLAACGASLSTFGTEHIESFFNDVETRCAPGTTTRLRYARMLDRLCRHLVDIEVRRSNPATGIVAFERWPDDEPLPLYLDPAADHRLQGWVTPTGTDDTRTLRNRAIVALLLGSGITAAELRRTERRHVVVDGVRPHVYVPKLGPREPRKVTLPEVLTCSTDRLERGAFPRGGSCTAFPGARKWHLNQRCVVRGRCERCARGDRVSRARHESPRASQYICPSTVAVGQD